MSCPDSRRCGTRLAYEEGCRRDSCRLMMFVWTKDDVRPSVEPSRLPPRIDAEPYARLLREFLRAGYTITALARFAGCTKETVRDIALGITTWVYPSTASALRSLVERLPSEASVSA